MLFRLRFRALSVAAATALAPLGALAAGELGILPCELNLFAREFPQRLLVEEFEGGRAVGQVRDGVTFESSDPSVVRVEDGQAYAVANGRAKIIARAGSRTAAIEVKVEGLEKPFRWSFRTHVESVLTRAGCNSGACHGAAAGKNGFKLSLRGYDPAGDFAVLTRQALGRRVVPSDPGRSLVLTKPSGLIPHKGGKRFEAGSREYEVLAQWIAAGTPAPRADDARVESVEILPAKAFLRPGGKQDLVVIAHLSDGRSEDVTRWTKLAGTNASVLQIDENGTVTVLGSGEGAVTAWYQSRIAVARVTVPFETQVPREAFALHSSRSEIDRIVATKLQELNIPPSLACTDAEFIRRSTIDTLGILPTPAEVKTFLADASPDKRDRWIEALLARPEYQDYWAYKWSDLLLVNSEKLRSPALWSFYTWIRNQVAANTPWDRFVRAIVTAKGSTLENGAANFFVLHEDPTDMAETTSLAFLGMSVGCARCHNHPMEKWTNDQYYAFANLFARVRAKDGVGDGYRTIYIADSGDLVQPLRGRPQPPRPLDGEAIASDAATGDRREALAEWLCSAGNPLFARSITNRVWANFLGVGLVENVDDLRATNPPSNDELLAAASRILVESGFDLKALQREILRSETYQRSSQPLPDNVADRRFYSRYYPRRIMAEALLDAISQVTSVPTDFPGYPAGWRALQLPDSNVASYFLKSFGRAERHLTCECERTATPSMSQALHISNGDTLNQKLSAAGNRIDRMQKDGLSDAQVIEEAYLAALSRPPTPEQEAKLLPLLAVGPAERRQAIEDLFWSLLSSKEFLFNH